MEPAVDGRPSPTPTASSIISASSDLNDSRRAEAAAAETASDSEVDDDSDISNADRTEGKLDEGPDG